MNTRYPLLSGIKQPDDLKRIPIDSLPALAAEIRRMIINVVSENGGHLASNLGAVELTIALHRVFNSPIDKIIWDVGHQAYTHKLLTGRMKSFPTLRKLNGISGFPKRTESPHDILDAGHASTSISAALGILVGQKLNGADGSVIAVIGDGALTGGLAFEGLNHAGHLNKELIIVLNDNTMSISPNVGALSSYLSQITATKLYQGIKRGFSQIILKMPLFGKILFDFLFRLKKGIKAFLFHESIFSDLGFEYIGPIDGHNIRLMIKVFNQVRHIREKPIVVHIKTRKGKGYSHAEGDPAGYHGVSAFSIVNGKVEKKGNMTFTEAFSDSIARLGAENGRIIAITAAMKIGTGLSTFQTKYPDRFFDVGITEQHALTFAAGLALSGHRPVVAIYSTFMQRAVDQFIHDVALQKLPVIVMMDRSGLVGGDGETHQGIYDIPLFKAIPGITYLAPASKAEIDLMLRYALSLNEPVLIRYPKALCMPDSASLESPIEKGKGVFIRRNSADILLIALGGLLNEALEASNLLSQKGILSDVYNLRFIKPIDTMFLCGHAAGYSYIVVIEDGATTGGIGESIQSVIESAGMKKPFRKLGVPEIFPGQGTREELISQCGIDSEGIAEAVEEMLESSGKLRIVKTAAEGVKE
ncbi:MAG: 1-deoxy-D-xylulose-5-phosphate synthase [Spirochaetales bacterium]|nr:1-deoxy-D-xylulose-5-phosphate synthase [Spirochaetales bacterium]